MTSESNNVVLETLLSVCETMSENHYTWQDVSSIVSDITGVNLSPNACRKRYSRYIKNNSNFSNDEEYVDRKDEYKDMENIFKESYIKNQIEKQKIWDLKTQVRADIRRMSREDTLKEIAEEVFSNISKLPKLSNPSPISISKKRKDAILEISDWHYGIDVDNHFNKYNTDIAKNRIEYLTDRVYSILYKEEIDHLHVVNLGDMIAGRIHSQIRYQSRIDVITQIMEVSEYIAQMLSILSNFFKIDYYDTLDNHSRLEPKLSDSLDLESLARLTSWYLKQRLKDNENVVINENKFSDDIITFNVFNHKVLGVHGDKDNPSNVIEKLSMLTQEHYDLVLAAHYHHFQCDERNNTLLVGNGSLMGTDDFAKNLRLSGKPSQNLIICTPKSPVYCIYKIDLDSCIRATLD